MKIVVTGSESFVGKELISQSKKNGIEIIGLDLINANEKDYEFYQVDIKSSKINDIIPENVDAIVHLAALSRDPDCKGKAYNCFNINVMGTLNVINAAILKNVKQFIFASSEWVYDEFIKREEKDEDSSINIANHSSEYALSKLVSEVNLRQQYNNGFCPTTILRFGIIYGPRKDNWSAVESVSSSVKNQNEVTVGSLKTGRRFIHVSDIARGIIKSIGLSGFNIINLTGNKIITLDDVIQKSQSIFGKSVKVIEKNSSQISIRNPSNKKAKKMLNWEPQIDLEQGIESLREFL